MHRSALRPGNAFAALLVLATFALLAAASCAESVPQDGGCADGLTTCGGACVDTQADPAHCGACDVACAAGAPCEAGACVTSCSAGLTECSGGCVDLQTDSSHCGGCAVACPPNAPCDAGVCQAPCPTGLSECDGLCIDTQNDADHCGACGDPCGFDETCAMGQCVGPCGPTQTMCGGSCVDTQTNDDHCGGCNITCSPGFPCTNGVCTNPCPGGLSYCAGNCVDLQTDPDHCGSCIESCDTTTETCQLGQCVCPGATCGFCDGITDLGSTVPQTVTGNTLGASNDFEPFCVFPGSNEVAFSFTAPADGQYRFDLTGSNFETGLALVDPQGCSQVACDDGFPGAQSKLTYTMTQGQQVIVVVDGWGGSLGAYQLSVYQPAPPMCPTGTLGSTAPQTVTGTTIGAGDAHSPSCSFGASGDNSYTFTAPATGTYVFNTAGSSFNTVVAVLDGGCTGFELACNDDTSTSIHAKATVNLTQGQTVIVVVDGTFDEEGDYVLSVAQAAPPMCPTGALGSTVPQTVTGSTTGAGDALVPSCAFTGSGDNSYTFTAPADGTYSFNSAGSTFNTVLAVRDIACNGPEIACNDDYGGSPQAFTYVTLAAGQIVIVSIDGAGGDEGGYTLTVDNYTPPPCPATTLPSMVPQTVSGTTNGQPDMFTPTCGFGGGPEVTYGFTAPAAGLYTFDTVGSVFDTILHVHNGTCIGAELACDDDTVGVQSEVTVSLAAGQTVVIMVDGYGGSSGSYILNVHQ